MRRRLKEAAEAQYPPHLMRYDAADWPNPECHPECAFWAALERWHEENPDDPDDTRPLIFVDGPNVPWHPEWI